MTRRMPCSAGADGMAVIGPIVRRAAGWLAAGGLLAVEHDDTTSAATVEAIARTALSST